MRSLRALALTLAAAAALLATNAATSQAAPVTSSTTASNTFTIHFIESAPVGTDPVYFYVYHLGSPHNGRTTHPISPGQGTSLSLPVSTVGIVTDLMDGRTGQYLGTTSLTPAQERPIVWILGEYSGGQWHVERA